MKLIRTLSTLLGAGMLTALTLALVLPAQEPTEDPPPAPASETDPEVVEEAVPAETEAAAPAEEDEMRELGAEVTAEEVSNEADKTEAVVEEVVAEIVEEIIDDIHVDMEPSVTVKVDRKRGHRGGEIVQIRSDAILEAGDYTDTVVAVMGNVLIEGEVGGEAVAVLGNNTVNGHVHYEAIAVGGNVTINGTVESDVVAVLGNVQLGPDAVVGGEIVCIGGRLQKAPGAVVDGPVTEVPFLSESFVESLHVWLQKCLFLFRPLALDARLSALWMMMFSFLAAYVLLALMMGGPVTRCAETMEEKPGMSLVTALLTIVLTPIVMVVLSVTVVGPPVLGMLLFFIGIFGKVVFLAWLGRRITEPLGWKFPALAVLLGGLILLGIYLVPVLGFMMLKFSGFLGTGIVVYTILQLMQENRPAPSAPGAGAVPSPMGGSGVPAGGSVVSDATGMPTSAAATAGAVPSATAGVPLQYSTLPRAGFWLRFAAGLLDFLVLGLAGAILGVESMFPLLATAYFIVMWALKGTTVGGVVLGIKVVRLDDRPVDWPVAVVRSLGSFLSFIVMGLGFLWVVWDPQSQSWHDKIAGTTVVRVPKGVSLV
jgi:uncharacterized RDD family membrane protein YckC/cytoskeletal protein CcmA (bactofilin family)